MATVYLADPDVAYRKALARALRQRGIDVEEFDNGSELYARAVSSDPDLIVMETDLDEMDGFQVFARLGRKRPSRPYRVVFVTQFEHPRVAKVCRERGALAYFGKNRPQEEVVAGLVSLLPEGDPLARRTLPAALAWLQSRGKSGRLDVQHGVRQGDAGGYVLLHNGRILEAQWADTALAPDQVTTLISESLSEARFRFVEAADALELPLPDSPAPAHGGAPPAPDWPAGIPPRVLAPVSGVGAPAPNESDILIVGHDQAPSARARAAEPATPAVSSQRSAGPASVARPATTPRDPLRHPAGAPGREGGSVAALRQLESARRPSASGQRRVAAVAGGLVLLLLAGLALATFYPGYLPAGLAGVLSGLGVEPARERVEDPGAQLARATENAWDDVAGGSDPASDRGPSVAILDDAGTSAESADQTPDVPREDPGPTENAPASVETASPAAKTPASPDEPDRDAPPASSRTAGPSGGADMPAELGAGADPGESSRETTAGRRPETREATTPSPVTSRRAPPLPAPSAPAAAARSKAPTPDRGPAGEHSTERAGSRSADAPPELVQKPVLLQRESDLYYPPELRSQGIGGSVLLNIRVGTNGRAQQVEIRKSSGYEAFDQAAVAAVGTFLWDPARDTDGPTETWITQAVTFRP